MQWPQVKNITKKSFDGRTYYMYEANASYGTLGPHTLTTVTTKVGLLHPTDRCQDPGMIRLTQALPSQYCW